MQFAFCVRQKKSKFEVYMRITSFADKAATHHEFPVKLYHDEERALEKARKLQEAAKPLALQLPMTYKTERIALLPKTVGPISREAK